MVAFLGNLRNVVLAGLVLAGLVFAIYLQTQGFDAAGFWPFLVRWLHVLSGVMWIGLLWYFNVVAMPTAAKMPDHLRPALTQFITPTALFWFRWSAMGTLVFGVLLAFQNGYLLEAYTLDSIEGFVSPKAIVIGIGMWLGTIMWFNVWVLVWPNQQRALNIAGKYPDLSAAEKAVSAKTAGQFSRINMVLSIPMLFCMVAAQNIF